MASSAGHRSGTSGLPSGDVRASGTGGGGGSSFVPTLEGDYIKFTFPLRCPFRCVIGNCGVEIKSGTWRSAKGALMRHMKSIHKYTPKDWIFWCGLCNIDLGKRANDHICFKRVPIFTKTNEECQFKCNECNESYPTYRGLSNHRQTHKRRTIKSKYNRENGLPTVDDHVSVDTGDGSGVVPLTRF